MLMRKFVKIIEGIENDLDRIRNYLSQEYWGVVENTADHEVWKHVDDDSIGAYIINYSPDKKHIKDVIYLSSLSPIFSRIFKSTGELIQHISMITADDFDVAAGMTKLQDIAKKLRRKDGEKDEKS